MFYNRMCYNAVMSRIEVGRGESYVFSMNYTNSDDSPIDLTTHEIKLSILEPNMPNAAPVFESTAARTNDGSVVIDIPVSQTIKMERGLYIVLVTDTLNDTTEWIFKDEILIKEPSALEV